MPATITAPAPAVKWTAPEVRQLSDLPYRVLGHTYEPTDILAAFRLDTHAREYEAYVTNSSPERLPILLTHQVKRRTCSARMASENFPYDETLAALRKAIADIEELRDHACDYDGFDYCRVCGRDGRS